MAESLTTKLTRVQTAIAELEAAGMVDEYQVAGGRRVRRDIPNRLRVLYQREQRLLVAIARANRSPVRVGSTGRPRGVDR